jgi:hypothetical protein
LRANKNGVAVTPVVHQGVGMISDRLFKLTTFVVVQRDDNAIPIAADEFKGVIIVGGDFVH